MDAFAVRVVFCSAFLGLHCVVDRTEAETTCNKREQTLIPQSQRSLSGRCLRWNGRLLPDRQLDPPCIVSASTDVQPDRDDVVLSVESFLRQLGFQLELQHEHCVGLYCPVDHHPRSQNSETEVGDDG